MSLLRTVSSLGRIKLTFVLGHCQLFSRSNGTTRKTVSKKEALEDVSERDNEVCLAQTHSTLGVQQMLSHINSSLSTIVIQKIPKGLQTQCLHLFPSSISEVTTSEYIFFKKKKINMLCNGENTKKNL